MGREMAFTPFSLAAPPCLTPLAPLSPHPLLQAVQDLSALDIGGGFRTQLLSVGVTRAGCGGTGRHQGTKGTYGVAPSLATGLSVVASGSHLGA